VSSNAIAWSGVFPAVTTQFKPDFSLDSEATHCVMRNLVLATLPALPDVGL